MRYGASWESWWSDESFFSSRRFAKAARCLLALGWIDRYSDGIGLGRVVGVFEHANIKLCTRTTFDRL